MPQPLRQQGSSLARLLKKQTPRLETVIARFIHGNTLPAYRTWKKEKEYFSGAGSATADLLARETLLTMFVRICAERIDGTRLEEFHDPLSDAIAEVIGEKEKHIGQLLSEHADIFIEEHQKSRSVEPLSDLYTDLIPRAQRKWTGEYQTPPALQKEMLEKMKPFGNKVVLDPSCGIGSILHTLIAHSGARKVAGYDINPCALQCARLSVLCALSLTKSLKQSGPLPVFKYDAFSEEPLPMPPADLVVGNAPWANYAALAPEYREKLKQYWIRYGLAPERGYAMLLGESRGDLAHLFFIRAMDRFLAQDGHIAMILPLSSVKGKESSSRFRRSIVTGDISIDEILDCSELQLFRGATTLSAIVFARKSATATRQAIPLVRLRSDGSREKLVSMSMKAAAGEKGSLSPWVIVPADKKRLISKLIGENSYRIRQGINTCGANTIFMFGEGSHPDVEEEYLYPLLAGADVRRWKGEPTMKIIFPYHPERPKEPVPFRELKERAPKLAEYFKRHEKELRSRRSRVIEHHITAGRYYALFGTGEYLFCGAKVVWQAFGARRLEAAVVDTTHGKPIVPNQARHAYCSVSSREEACYLAAILNSGSAQFFCEAVGQPGGKNFAQSSVLKHLAIPPYNAHDPLHRELSEIGGECDAGQLTREGKIDTLVSTLFRTT